MATPSSSAPAASMTLGQIIAQQVQRLCALGGELRASERDEYATWIDQQVEQLVAARLRVAASSAGPTTREDVRDPLSLTSGHVWPEEATH